MTISQPHPNEELPYTEADLAIGRSALLRGWTSDDVECPTIVRAAGAQVWDADGVEYIDCTSQAWSNNIGASDPRVVEAAMRQAATLSHLRSTFDSVPLLLLVKKLVETAPPGLDRVSFCLHGSLAIETAMKIAMINADGPGPFLTLRDGYHGRSLATMGLSWPHPNTRYVGLYPPVIRLPQPYVYRAKRGLTSSEVVDECIDELRDVIARGASAKPVALIMEPVQGNGGQLDFPQEYYERVREVCSETGTLLIWDEIQTGFGRCGRLWASELYGVTPDILVFGKGIGGGFPLAGVLARDGLKPPEAGDDAFTFAQFPVSLAASLAAFEVLEEDDLLENCRAMGALATERLLEMKSRHPLIGDVRGPGLLIGIELVRDQNTKEPARTEMEEVYKRGLARGVIFGTTRYSGLGNVMKIKPPLCITRPQMERVLTVFDEVLTEVEAEA